MSAKFLTEKKNVFAGGFPHFFNESRQQIIMVYVDMMMDANAAITLLKFHALNGIRSHDLCVTGAMVSQLSYQSHLRAVVCGFVGPLLTARP